MEVKNANNLSVKDKNAKEIQESRLFVKHVSRIEKRRKPLYRNNNHPKTVLKMMNDMRIQNILCDITLVADSVEIPAHKMVLASCSPYFYAMFNSFDESKQQRITLKEVDHQALILLIEYAYTSEVMVTEENVQDLLSASNLFQIMDVRDACCEFLKDQLHRTNCLGIRAFADMHGCLDLLANSESFIEQHFSQVVKCEEFLSLTHQQVSKWISSDGLTVPSEEKVFECVIRWVKHDLENRRKHLASLMDYVRLPLLSEDYMAQRVEEEPLLKVDLQCNYYLTEALTYHLHIGDGKTNFRTRPRQPNKLLLVVGSNARTNVSSIECFDFKEERWYQVVEMRVRKNWGHLAVLNGRVYSVGGRSEDELQSIDVYNPVLDQWSLCAFMEDERYRLGVAVLDNCIYVVGGCDSSGPLNTAEVFDTRTRYCKRISPMSTKRRQVGVAVLNNLVYAVGGFDGDMSLSSVECYNPESDTWSRVADMLFERNGAGVAALDGKLYAVGGRYGSHVRKSVEAYNPDKQTWRPVASMTDRRANAGVVAMNGLLYVVGGNDGRCDLSSIEVYNPEKDTWTMLPSCMCTGRNYVGLGMIDKSTMKVTSC